MLTSAHFPMESPGEPPSGGTAGVRGRLPDEGRGAATAAHVGGTLPPWRPIPSARFGGGRWGGGGDMRNGGVPRRGHETGDHKADAQEYNRDVSGHVTRAGGGGTCGTSDSMLQRPFPGIFKKEGWGGWEGGCHKRKPFRGSGGGGGKGTVRSKGDFFGFLANGALLGFWENNRWSRPMAAPPPHA